MNALLKQINKVVEATADPEGEGYIPDPKPNLQRIVSDLLYHSKSDVRYAVYLNDKDLTKHYLVMGGTGASVLELMDDTELLHFAQGSDNSRIKKFDDTFKLSNLISSPPSIGGAARAVMIDYPKAAASALQVAADKYAGSKSEPDKRALQQQLEKMLAHRYYVMTINVSKAKAIVDDVDAHSDVDGWVTTFDPSVIEDYPVRAVWTGAKDEWSMKKKRKEAEKSKQVEPEDAVADAEKKMATAAAEIPKKDLTQDEMMDQIKGLWDAWKTTGQPTSKEFRDMLKNIRDEAIKSKSKD